MIQEGWETESWCLESAEQRREKRRGKKRRGGRAGLAVASSHGRGGHAEGHPVGGGCHGATCSRGCGPSLVRQCDLQMVTGRVRGGVQGSGGSLVGQDGAWSSSPQPLWPPHPIALPIPNALFMSPIQRPPFSIPVTLARGAPPHGANTPVPRISVQNPSSQCRAGSSEGASSLPFQSQS